MRENGINNFHQLQKSTYRVQKIAVGCYLLIRIPHYSMLMLPVQKLGKVNMWV
jgi:hypothetical protein